MAHQCLVWLRVLMSSERYRPLRILKRCQIRGVQEPEVNTVKTIPDKTTFTTWAERNISEVLNDEAEFKRTELEGLSREESSALASRLISMSDLPPVLPSYLLPLV